MPQRVLLGLDHLLQRDGLTEEAKKAVGDVFIELETSPAKLIQYMHGLAFETKTRTLEYQSQVGVMGQYAQEGGAYQVTGADRAQVEQRAQLDESVVDTLEELPAKLGGLVKKSHMAFFE